MGILSRAFEQRSTLANPAQWLIDWVSGGAPSGTGITVNDTTAMQSTAVFACVRIISEAIASLPLPVYEKLYPRGKQRAPDHPLYRVLHDIGNSEMTAMTLRQTLQGHAVLRGNAYAEIEYDNAGRVIGLWPLRPDKTRPWRDPQTKVLWYITQLPSGQEVKLPKERVFHLLGLAGDGIVGYSPIRQAAEAIGLTLATERYGAALFGNGARPGGIITIPQSLADMSEQAKERLRLSWEERHQGLSKAHRIAILDEGMKWEQVGIHPDEAQFLETRKFQVTDIARLFHVPPHMIADLERATNNNIEHQGLEFVVFTLRPWLVQWEQTIAWKLLTEEERRRYYAEHVIDGLLRGDYKSRMEGYHFARQDGWMSANDIRELENLNPLPPEIGDAYLVNGNMTPVHKAGQKPTEPVKGGETGAGS